MRTGDQDRTRRSQLIRTLRLIRDLDREWTPITVFAARYGVTPKTIRRDMAFLQRHGFAIVKRVPAITESQVVEWHLAAWPDRYDLTLASPQPVAETRRAG